MKTIFYLICCCLLPTTLPAQQLGNLDFESDANWLPRRLTEAVFLVPTPDGKGQCATVAAPFTEYGSGYVYQEIPVSVKKASRYTITAKVRTRGVVGRGAQIYVYGKIAGEMAGYKQTQPLRGDTEWEAVTLDLILDRNMDTLRVGCFLEGTGQAWFDDLTFTPYKPQEGETSPIALAYLQEFFDTASRYALYRDQIDWSTLKADAISLAWGAQEPADVYPAIEYTIRKINKHSFFMPPAIAADMSGANLTEDEIKPDLEYTFGRRVNASVAYLSMPAMGSGHQPTLEAFADSLQGLIAALDTEETTGWVLDLRNNGGGNCWPMLAGVGPLLGEGVCGYFQAPDGGNAQPWSYAKGKSALSGQDIVGTRNYQLKNPEARIAVLTGPMTASSGEVTTTAFIAHPRARSFGLPTAGYATTNNNYPLSDGAVVYLTISVYADRNNQPVGETIKPDEEVAPEEGKDTALDAAVDWLKDGK